MLLFCTSATCHKIEKWYNIRETGEEALAVPEMSAKSSVIKSGYLIPSKRKRVLAIHSNYVMAIKVVNENETCFL